MITFDDIRTAYDALADATRIAHAEMEAALYVKSALETARAAAIWAGDVEGKNEAQREANLRHKLLARYDAVDAAERDAREARHEVEQARLRVEALRLEMRLAELLAAGGVPEMAA